MAERHPPEHLFVALSHEVRRALLEELSLDSTADQSLDDVIAGLADRIGEPRRQLELRCYHCHLPKLAELDLVDYDWDDGTIRYDGDVPAAAVRSVLTSFEG